MQQGHFTRYVTGLLDLSPCSRLSFAQLLKGLLQPQGNDMLSVSTMPLPQVQCISSTTTNADDELAICHGGGL